MSLHEEIEPISYAEAKSKGLDYYFSGEPCKYNQVAKRNIKTRHCLCFICVAKQQYQVKNYHDENRDKRNLQRVTRNKKTRIKPHNPVFIKP